MKEVKTQKRYKCDFCKIRGIKRKIEFHEGQCYRNPNRFCKLCENTREVDSGFEGRMVACDFCKSFDAKKLEEIEKREAENSFLQVDINEEINLPF